jgi:hypothetical protein
MTAQFLPGLSRAEYDALPGWNSSLLKIAATRTPAHAWAAYRDPAAPGSTDSSALLVGSALHCLLLEPDEFSKRYVSPPADVPRRPTEKQLETPTAKPGTKAYTAWEDACARRDWWEKFDTENANREWLSPADHAMVGNLYQSIVTHPALGPWFAPSPNSLNEVTITWHDPVTGAQCKARLDKLVLLSHHILILDLKSAADASPPEFGRAAVRFGYLAQGAFYTDGLHACRRSLAEHLNLSADALDSFPIVFEFIVPEKSYPWLVARYFLTEEQLAIGRDRYQPALQSVIAAEATGYWPGYDHAALPLELPPWFK